MAQAFCTALRTRTSDPTAVDVIYGGAGIRIGPVHPWRSRRPKGDARDADVILGDNGNIFRLVGPWTAVICGSTTTPTQPDVDHPAGVRVPGLHPGGADTDIGDADLIYGEDGDDTIAGQVGQDVIFGDGNDDDLYGGAGCRPDLRWKRRGRHPR